MLIRIICVGKTANKPIQVLLDEYTKRLMNYTKIEWNFLEIGGNSAKMNKEQTQVLEWQKITKVLTANSFVVLLDEKGKEFTSIDFSKKIQKIMNSGTKEIAFIVGGAYGFCKEAYEKTDENISLSQLTFTHQMVRVIIIEQLYRAFTILKGEKYHH
jgi:23S rRNA (pseudouridine1915-N3)-methyltransferase